MEQVHKTVYKMSEADFEFSLLSHFGDHLGKKWAIFRRLSKMNFSKDPKTWEKMKN